MTSDLRRAMEKLIKLMQNLCPKRALQSMTTASLE